MADFEPKVLSTEFSRTVRSVNNLLQASIKIPGWKVERNPRYSRTDIWTPQVSTPDGSPAIMREVFTSLTYDPRNSDQVVGITVTDHDRVVEVRNTRVTELLKVQTPDSALSFSQEWDPEGALRVVLIQFNGEVRKDFPMGRPHWSTTTENASAMVQYAGSMDGNRLSRNYWKASTDNIRGALDIFPFTVHQGESLPFGPKVIETFEQAAIKGSATGNSVIDHRIKGLVPDMTIPSQLLEGFVAKSGLQAAQLNDYPSFRKGDISALHTQRILTSQKNTA